MISLSRHIELLLLEHDCVIVPGLGGFIANHAEAQYNGDGDLLFLPPYRTIRFNQQLQMNDGLLVQSYMAAYDASYPAAQLQMEKDIEKVVYELEVSGEFNFEPIGVLKKDLSHGISFTPQETSFLTPSLYGLYSYEIKSLSSLIKEKEVEEALCAASAMAVSGGETMKDGDKEGDNDVSIHRHRRWIDVGISVAAAVVLLFFFSYQALSNTGSDTDMVVAAFYPTSDAQAVKPSTNNGSAKPIKTAENKTALAATVVKNMPAKKVATEKPAAVHEVQEPKFAIVLASFVNKTNAEAFIEKLSKQGLAEGRYVKNDNVSRILYSNYTSKEEAHMALQELRQQSDEFAQAWILEL